MTKAEFAWLVVAGVVICFFAGPVRADDRLWVSASLRAWHSDRNAGYNANTYGVGAEYERGSVSAALGEYHNSVRRTSVYGGFAWRPLRLGPVRAGVLGGAVSGYRPGVVWVALPVLSVEVGRIGVNVIVAPSTADSPGMAALQVKWRL